MFWLAFNFEGVWDPEISKKGGLFPRSDVRIRKWSQHAISSFFFWGGGGTIGNEIVTK